jgi:hypothetical protein
MTNPESSVGPAPTAESLVALVILRAVEHGFDPYRVAQALGVELQRAEALIADATASLRVWNHPRQV